MHYYPYVPQDQIPYWCKRCKTNVTVGIEDFHWFFEGMVYKCTECGQAIGDYWLLVRNAVDSWPEPFCFFPAFRISVNEVKGSMTPGTINWVDMRDFGVSETAQILKLGVYPEKGRQVRPVLTDMIDYLTEMGDSPDTEVIQGIANQYTHTSAYIQLQLPHKYMVYLAKLNKWESREVDLFWEVLFVDLDYSELIVEQMFLVIEAFAMKRYETVLAFGQTVVEMKAEQLFKDDGKPGDHLNRMHTMAENVGIPPLRHDIWNLLWGLRKRRNAILHGGGMVGKLTRDETVSYLTAILFFVQYVNYILSRQD